MVDKVYWAWLEGVLDHDEGTWTDRVRKIPNQAQAQVVAADHPDSRQAVLRYRVRGRTSELTLLEISLETGRFHQIRVQCSAHGTPVAGDLQYGATRVFGPACEDERQRCIALHARRLSFYHPMTREPLTIEAPLPDYWDELPCG